MLLDIDKIKVTDRIRKDFGNIQELADDIKENGLINPPVVTPEFELIAGERRLRACKLLGMNAITVNVMSVRDYEHQLRLEISENENRKEFTYSERIEWARRLEQVEKLKAKERMSEGGKGVENFPDLEKGRTRDRVAREAGFGSGKQYEKAKFISENADPDIIRQLDEEKISINRAYLETKQKLEAAEHAAREAQARAEEAERQLAELRNKPEPEPQMIEVEKIIEKEVVPEAVQRQLSEAQMKAREIDKVKAENKKLRFELESAKANPVDDRLEMEAKVSTFTGRIKTFLREMAPLGYMGQEVMRTSPQAQREYETSIVALEKWCQDMRDAMISPRETKIIDVEVIQ